jgi:hypothetical protein
MSNNPLWSSWFDALTAKHGTPKLTWETLKVVTAHFRPERCCRCGITVEDFDRRLIAEHPHLKGMTAWITGGCWEDLGDGWLCGDCADSDL